MLSKTWTFDVVTALAVKRLFALSLFGLISLPFPKFLRFSSFFHILYFIPIELIFGIKESFKWWPQSQVPTIFQTLN